MVMAVLFLFFCWLVLLAVSRRGQSEVWGPDEESARAARAQEVNKNGGKGKIQNKDLFG